MLRDVITVAEEFQIVLASEARNELLIGIRFCPAQFVIEMDDRHDNSKLSAQLEQKPQ